MNWLVYLGLEQYSHLPAVRGAQAALAAQSEATFLVEWAANHRVMENFNSVTGAGCDVQNAIPFCKCWTPPFPVVPSACPCHFSHCSPLPLKCAFAQTTGAL